MDHLLSRKTQPILSLQQVSCQFDSVSALAEISLSIYPQERVALVGASGAGKSTLLRLLNGSILPSEGEVSALGYVLSQLSSRRRRQIQRQIGTVYQQHHLVMNLPVIHNVNAGHLGRWSLAKAAGSLLWPLEVESAAQALAQVGIPETLYARTDKLSGGQQQRVAIARLLIQNPEIILADEPIASVDPERARGIMDLLRQRCDAEGKTLVVSLHDVAFARSHCDRIIGLRTGRVLFDAPTDQVSDQMFDELYRF
ncbi:MAG: ATP-binding cassette domain-containing protein [Cyanobacteria bacterium P01_F01_bin.4]